MKTDWWGNSLGCKSSVFRNIFKMQKNKKYFSEYYKRRREEYISLLGGACAECGSAQQLQFHHIDEKNKSFSIGKLMNFSKETSLQELKKCVLLCSTCHKKLHIKNGTFIKLGGRKEGSCGANNKKSRKVICINTGKTYECMSDCANDLGFDPKRNHISDVCRGIRKSYKGYTFRYL